MCYNAFVNFSSETKVLLGGVLATVLIVGGIVVWVGKEGGSVLSQAEIVGQARHIRGNSEAGVTITEFSDFQCPACKASQPVLDQVLAEYPDQVRLVFRHFPLRVIHRNAFGAAQAAEAADAQGKFWEMHDLLFERQEEWSDLDSPKEKFVEYAQELGLNTDLFKKALDEGEFADLVSEDEKIVSSLRLNSTPTFFINDQKMTESATFANFEKSIDELLEEINQ